MQPDEAFLKSIEEQIAIIGPAADGFRQEVIAYLWAHQRGEIATPPTSPWEAVEKKLMNSVRDISRIITKARTRDGEQRQKYDSMVENLMGGAQRGQHRHDPEVRRQPSGPNPRRCPGRRVPGMSTIFRPYSESEALRVRPQLRRPQAPPGEAAPVDPREHRRRHRRGEHHRP